MRFILKISLLALIAFSVLSCRKSFETDWDVDLAAPIARSKLNIKNFFGDTLFQTDPTGLIHLAFSKKIAGFQLDSLVQIPDTVIPKSFPIPPNITVTPSQVIPGFPQTTDINFNIPDGVELKNAIIQSGTLKIVYSNTFTQPLTFSLTLPTSSRYGFPFTIQETINPGSNGLVKYYDISGYNVWLTGTNNNKTNTLPQTVNVMVSPNAQTDVTGANQFVQADISYSDILPYYLEGYFGEQTIDLPYDSVGLNISNNLQTDNFQINTASINFKIINQFGVDINAQLSNINSLNSTKNTSVALNAPGLSNININRAGKTSQLSTPVFPSLKTISVNTGNSNIKPFLENLPDYLTYQGKIVVNPLGNVSGSGDFAYLNTGISIYADVDMPLEINAGYFKLVSKSLIDLTGVKQIDDINYGDIVIQATNGFPFDAVLQGYILDEKEQVIDSLFNVPGNVIKSGNIDALTNLVLSPVFTKLAVPMTKEKLANLKLCKSIRFVSRFDLPPQPPDIKILDSYVLDLIVSLDVNYKARKR